MSELKLKESIDSVVRANGNREISGSVLNGVLKDIVDGGKELGRDYYFYPSVIKEACINNEDTLLYDNYPIAIASINFSTHIVTINKKIVLPPDVSGNAFATKWQMYLVGVSALDANNILQLIGQTSVSTFTFEVVTGQTSATLQARFITNAVIGFVNPYMTYLPLSSTPIEVDDSFGEGVVNHFCQYLYKQNDLYVGIFNVNDGSTNMGIGVATSYDFINWSAITKITQVCTYAPWMDETEDIADIVPRVSLNSKVGGKFVFPLAFLLNGTSVGRIGIASTPDFGNYEASENYFTCDDPIFVDDTTVSWWYPTYAIHNNKHLLASVITVSGVQDLYLFEWDGNLETMSLQLVQKISGNRKNGQFNKYITSVPNLFTYKGNLFLSVNGLEEGGVDHYKNGNMSNSTGLYIYDAASGLFKEFVSNPWMINPKLSSWGSNFYMHSGQVACMEDEDGTVKCIPAMNHGSNTYTVFPCRLNLKSKNEINDWILKNSIL